MEEINLDNIVIAGGRVICPAQNLDAVKDVVVTNGKISSLESPGAQKYSHEYRIVDATGMLVVPGLVDIHTHLREPGQEWKETILSGTRAAVAGGFTSVCCMPNTEPCNDEASVTEFIIKQAAAANLARVYPIGAITVGRQSKSLAPMVELREAGCIAFSDDGAPVKHAGIMRRALEYCKMIGVVLTVHEEETQLSGEYSMNESVLSLQMGLKGMPGAAEDVMISRDIELARLTGGRVHFCHVSTARAVTLIRRAKEDGISVTAEVSPHHFTLTEECCLDFNTQGKVSMPLRSEADRAAVLKGLGEGTIDCIASDHAPHEADSKNCEFDKASFGFIGFQTTLPLTLAQVRSGKLNMMRAVSALTDSATKCLNLPRAALLRGMNADITVIDEDVRYTIEPGMILSKSKNTPFLGQTMQGRAVACFVRGREVYNIHKQSEGQSV